MAGGFSLSGLASGLDTETIVQQLIALERQPQNRVAQKKRQAEARKDQLNEVLSKLKSLKTAAADLKSVGLWAPVQTVDVSDPTKVTAERTGNAGIGGYQLEINRLAVAEQWSFDYTTNTGADTTITVNGVAITISANSDINAAVDAINAKTDSPVYAVASGGKLVMSAKTTGAGSSFTASGSTLTNGVETKQGAPAEYRIDGQPAGSWTPSETNVVETAIPGLKLTLKAVTSSPITVNVGAPTADTKVVKDKVKAFVEAYNSTVELVRRKIDEDKVRDPQNNIDLVKGVLSHDTMLGGILSRMRTELMGETLGNPADLDELAELGITTGAAAGTGTVSSDAVKGKLVLDEAKLDEALAGRSADVRRLLSGADGVDGFAQRFEALLDPVTTLDGEMEDRIDSADSEIKRHNEAIDRMELRLAAREKMLRAQFTAMEQALQNSQSQGNWLGSQLAALGQR